VGMIRIELITSRGQHIDRQLFLSPIKDCKNNFLKELFLEAYQIDNL